MAKGTIRKLPSGSWELIYDAPKQPGQKRNQKSVTFKGTPKQAEKKLRELLRSIDDGTYTENNKMTVGQFLLRWLADYCKPNLEQTTIDGYRVIIENHLIPALGDLKLDKLQPLNLQTYYADALTKPPDGRERPLSARTVLSHHKVLHRALRHAVKWQLLTRNVSEAVDPPKVKQYESEVYDEMKVSELLRALQGTRLYLPILLDLATGLRRGELMALRWKDVDLDGKTITVNQSLAATSEGLIFKTPKTKKSKRSVALPHSVAEEFGRHKKAGQGKEKLAAGKAYLETDLVFCQEDGSVWHPNSFSCAFRRFLKEKGMEHIRLHDLRHTHASLLLRQGVHPKIVSDRLGHSKIGITMDLYSHIMPGMQEAVAQDLDDTIFKKAKKQPSL